MANLDRYDVVEMTDFLVEYGISSEVAYNFEKNCIDGKSFLKLTNEDLKELVPLLCPEMQTSLLHLSFPEYLKHLELFQPHFSITCGIGGCMRTFTNLRTFRNHVSGFHSIVDGPEEESDGNDESAQFSDDSCDDVSDTIDFNNVNIDEHGVTSPLEMSAALFILNLKEKQKLTQVK